MSTETAKEHLAFCVERAMEYADQGNMVQAWASFLSDCNKHAGTAHISTHLLTGMEMTRQVQTGASAGEFRHFIEGWNV